MGQGWGSYHCDVWKIVQCSFKYFEQYFLGDGRRILNTWIRYYDIIFYTMHSYEFDTVNLDVNL